MALTAPTNLNEIRERKSMTQETNCENFTKVPNAFLDQHLNQITHLPELKITLAIIRKTIGYNKQSDIISYSQFEEMTGMTRPSVCDGINFALERGLVTREKSGQYWKYSIKVVALDYQYPLTTSSRRLPEVVAVDYQFDQKVVAVDYPQKKVFKENIKKEETTPKGVAAAPQKSTMIDMSDTGPYQEKQPEPEQKAHAPYPAPSPTPTTPIDIDKPKPKARDKPSTLHPALKVYQETFKLLPEKRKHQAIIDKIGEKPDVLCEWGKACYQWNLKPWKPGNIAGLLNYFEEGNYKNDLPGTPNRNDRGRGMGSAGKDRPRPANTRPSITEFYSQSPEAIEEQFRRELAELGFSNKSFS